MAGVFEFFHCGLMQDCYSDAKVRHDYGPSKWTGIK
jgi:hypothetical protein